MEKEITLYCMLIADIENIRKALEKLYPENKYSLIESGTVLLSEGDVFDCSVEMHEKRLYYMSATYTGGEAELAALLTGLQASFEEQKIVYSIDIEQQIGDEYTERNISHPDYLRLIDSDEK